MGSIIGVQKVAARRLGIPWEEYTQRTASGQKWCVGCREWHPVTEFVEDVSRGDRLYPYCRKARRELNSRVYARKGRRLEPVDQRRARRIVQMRVRRGTMPHPQTVPCMDCGHTGDDKRHEYDHYRGYSPQNHADVQPVCSKCHAARERGRDNG